MQNQQPKHIAIIMDGNGRWALSKGKSRSAGHRKGVETLETILKHVFELGVPVLTVYAFSTENAKRPEEEVKGLVRLIKEFFKKGLVKFIAKQTRIKIIGDRKYFDPSVQDMIKNAEEQTAQFSDKTFVLALNYGARNEIIRAVNSAVSRGQAVDEHTFSALLDTASLIEPDIIIRTGGDKRLSNFLLYQAAYAELFFIDTLWPNFSTAELDSIITQFSKRPRRFGKL